MKSFSASDAKNRFGQLIDMAQAVPVRVQRQGRDVAIVIVAGGVPPHGRGHARHDVHDLIDTRQGLAVRAMQHADTS